MANGNEGTSLRADRLGEILGAYFVAVEEGRAPMRQDLLAQHPDLAGELAEYFAEQDRLDRIVAPMRLPGEPPSTALDDLTASIGSVPHVLLRDTEPGSDSDPLIQPLSPEMPALADRPARLQLFGEIARGGMGAILRGRDVDLGRELAVKVLLESNQDHPTVVRRFIEEAQIGGQLQHPGIVPVYELGAFADRRPYFAMKLVKGQTLAALLTKRRISGPGTADLPRFLTIFEQICQTMAYAHARGVIHRDLKPSNVMVGAFGEVQVMDWGLAKVLPRSDGAERTPQDLDESDVMTVRSGSGSDASRAGSILGTPAYMAPEQARGELDRVDERADVFGLGAILCEILTGKPPFVGQTRDQICGKAAQGDLADAFSRLDASAADSELTSLAHDCLVADRQQRPRDAGMVSARITAHLSGVQDRLRKAELARVEAQARAEEERKRRRITVALATSVLLTTGIVGGGWSYLAREHQRRAVQVDLALREAELRRDDAQQAGDDLPRWLAARDAAQAVVRLVGDARDAATRDRVATLFEQVEQAAKTAQADQKLLEKLVDIRSGQSDDIDGSMTDEAYADVFREAGIDVDQLTADEVGMRIKARPAPISLALAAALDDWAITRRNASPKPAETWQRLVAAARAADSEPLRDRLRELWLKTDLRTQLEPLRKLAQVADTATWPAQTLLLLGDALVSAGDRDTAVGLLSRAQSVYPGDVWLNYNLGLLLAELSRRDESICFLTSARALRPETAHNLAHALAARGQSDQAIAVFRDLLRLRPSNAWHLTCLGKLLEQQGQSSKAKEILEAAVAAGREWIRIRPESLNAHNILGLGLLEEGKQDEAITEIRTVLRLRPDQPKGHCNLALALWLSGKREEALTELRTAIRLQPDFGMAHGYMGYALRELGKFDEAIAESQTAIRLKPNVPEYHSNLGIALGELGKLDEAIAEQRTAIRLKPDYALAHHSLGISMQGQGKLDEAIAEFRTAIRLNPEVAVWHSNLGDALKEQEKLDEAVAECRTALRIDPGIAEAHNNLGNALKAQGKRDEAIAEYRTAIRLKPEYAMAHSNLGVALQDQGKLDEALSEHRAAIRLKPDLDVAHINLGAYLGEQGKAEEAIAEFRTAIRLKPNKTEGHYNLGRVLSLQGKRDDAIAEYRAAIRVKPDNAGAHTNLGILLGELGKSAEAIGEYRTAISHQPDHVTAYLNLSYELRKRGKHDEAVAALRTAIRIKPGYARAHSNLGSCLGEQGKIDEAVAEFRTAIRLNHELADAHYNLGSALSAQGNVYEAIKEYRTALRIKPGYADAHTNLGLELERQGKKDEAIEELRAAIRYKPGDARCHCNLGSLLSGRGKLDDAIVEYRAALRLDPNLAEAHLSLGAALSAQGKTDDAIAECREAIRLKPNVILARYNLGNILRDGGKLVEAIAEFQAVIRAKPQFAEAYCNLGSILMRRGDYAGALENRRKGHELGSRRPDWRYPSAAWVTEAEQLLGLSQRLPGIVRGQDKPHDNHERLVLAQMAYNSKYFAVAARLWSETFENDPKLAEDMQAQHRYNAACAAALAGCGQGKDEPPLDEAAKSRWRKQAIDSLKADLAFWSKQVEAGPQQARAAIVQTLQHWKADTDLAGIREGTDLAKLPEAEQKACRSLWAEVEVVLKNAQSP